MPRIAYEFGQGILVNLIRTFRCYYILTLNSASAFFWKILSSSLRSSENDDAMCEKCTVNNLHMQDLEQYGVRHCICSKMSEDARTVQSVQSVQCARESEVIHAVGDACADQCMTTLAQYGAQSVICTWKTKPMGFKWPKQVLMYRYQWLAQVEKSN
jgi:hypothetical protein